MADETPPMSDQPNLTDQAEPGVAVATAPPTGKFEAAQVAPPVARATKTDNESLIEEVVGAVAAEVAGGAEPRAATGGDTPAALGTRAPSATPAAATPLEVPDFSAGGNRQPLAPLDLLDDVELNVKIELGRTQMYIEDVLRLGVGSVVELDKLAGDPVDIHVNERLVARGEVLVLNENFCVRINDIVGPTGEVEDGK